MFELSRCTECSCNATLSMTCSWAVRYNTWLLIKLTPEGVVFSFLNDTLKHLAQPERPDGPADRTWGDITYALQEVKSNSKVSSTGKSKRWSALAFWKKSAGKAKQPAGAKAAAAAATAAAAVYKADEEWAPLRGRSSSYHSSFIALAKQVSNVQLYMMFCMTHGCTKCKQCSVMQKLLLEVIGSNFPLHCADFFQQDLWCQFTPKVLSI